MTEQRRTRIWVVLGALALIAFVVTAVRAQQETTQEPQPSPIRLSGGVSASTYTDAASDDCEKSNANNPYAGMNPLVCHGEMMPPEGRNGCNFPGMQLIKQEDDSCFYCLPLNPPIVGIILPIDLAGLAEEQGFRCGEDQADACMLICTGTGTFKPPAGVRITSPPPGQPTPSPQPGPAQASTPPERPSPTTPQPTNPNIDCLAGFVAGVGDCVQGTVNTIAGAGYFFLGDWQNASKMWGLQPGQSVVINSLKGMYRDLSTVTSGDNVSVFAKCQIIGRQICTLLVRRVAQKAVAAATKGNGTPSSGGKSLPVAVGPSAGGPAGGGGGSLPVPISPGGGSFTQPAAPGNGSGGQPGSAPPTGSNVVISGGTSAGNAIGGLDLLGDLSANPGGLANKWVKLPSGPEQLGALAGKGSFAVVFHMPDGNVMKFSTEAPGSATALQGQVNGTKILNEIGIPTPSIISYQPPGFQQAGSLLTTDFKQQWPGSFQLSTKEFQDLTPEEQNAALGAIQQVGNRLAETGNVMLDPNPNNIAVQPNGGGYTAIVIDADMIMPVGEVPAATPSNSVAAGVLDFSRKLAGSGGQTAGQPDTAQSLMNTWQQAMTNWLRNGVNGQ